jgi:helicase
VASAWDQLDPRIRAALREHGIEKLYPPQEEALGPILRGKNLVVSIPTASGKSLVAYMAILHRRLADPSPGKALYIVPLRALASEKYEELKEFQKLGIRTALATGDYDEQDDRLGHFDVIVATSEKMDSLLRHRVGWLHNVRTIVADEVHLINDAGRGPTLEVLLSRFRALNPDAQVVALSATIKNSKQLAEWLGAELVQSEWRPTPLKKGVLFGRQITFEDGSTRILTHESADMIVDLVVDMIAEQGQCLVFVNARRSAEAVAKKLAKPVARALGIEDKTILAKLAKEVDDGEPSLSGRHLSELIAHGVAFHTAGLSSHQRRLVETQFREGKIKVICATPTLAAGVNTPARRVIIRDVYRYDANLGNSPIPVLEVQQMMGRAGRPRYDPYGEAVLLAKSEDERETLVQSYIEADPEPITSKLGSEPALRVHVLASIAAGFTPNRKLLDRFLDSTFYAHQGETWLIKARLEEILRFLVDNDFVIAQGDDLRPTLFGKRTSDLYVDPLSALTLRRAIRAAKERGADVSTFALLHAISSTVDINSLFLRQKDDWVFQKAAEVEEELLLGPNESGSYEEFLSHVKTAALLEDWMQETPMDQIEEKYAIGPGDLRNKVDVGEWLAHAMIELGRLETFKAQELNDLPLRLQSGAKKEILPLIQLQGIGRVRARVLWNSGYKSLGALRKARVEELARLPGFGERIAQSVKRQVGVENAPQEPTLEGF